MFSSSSIDLISSNETLNHENEVFKSNLDPIVENSQNSTKNRKTSVITSKIETFENIMRNHNIHKEFMNLAYHSRLITSYVFLRYKFFNTR